jgi:hypothetical protein
MKISGESCISNRPLGSPLASTSMTNFDSSGRLVGKSHI